MHIDIIVIYVSRYRGYCPQIKYRVGKTYGTDTHELAQVSQAFLIYSIIYQTFYID